MGISNWLASFKPGFDPVPLHEKVLSGVAVAASIGLMGGALHFLPQVDYPLLMLASMAASSALLFAVPHSPMTQPWSLVGGHFLSALVGWASSWLIPDPLLASSCAVSISLFFMQLLNCLHPPGSATALIIVLNAEQFHHFGWRWVSCMVTANTMILLLLALIINNLIPRRHYPMKHIYRSPTIHPTPAGAKPELVKEDIEWALVQMDSVIDVSEDDLLDIYRMAAEHAVAGKDAH